MIKASKYNSEQLLLIDTIYFVTKKHKKRQALHEIINLQQQGIL